MKTNYREPVKFTVTNQYGCGSDDDVYTVKEFRECVETGAFIDYDGFGNPVKNRLCDPDIMVFPSSVELISEDTTHIVWYNK